jgi:hypothetical protein
MDDKPLVLGHDMAWEGWEGGQKDVRSLSEQLAVLKTVNALDMWRLDLVRMRSEGCVH